MATKHKLSYRLFETLKDAPNTSERFGFVAFFVLEIPERSISTPFILGVGTKSLGT